MSDKEVPGEEERERERGTLLLFLATIEWCWRSGKRDGGV